MSKPCVTVPLLSFHHGGLDGGSSPEEVVRVSDVLSHILASENLSLIFFKEPDSFQFSIFSLDVSFLLLFCVASRKMMLLFIRRMFRDAIEPRRSGVLRGLPRTWAWESRVSSTITVEDPILNQFSPGLARSVGSVELVPRWSWTVG